uniref:Putative Athila retroelement ORF1-like protein n=1 Tax=Arabidopsis thaliana TaxID=3702 RepID=Q9XE42_ARATH|nr:putative Athila retroelement ORF1-like protein [Arabidopsis thaliana]AAM15273.1 putative Athila retroelement ORF1-like protein [Arabidopsis thaliana]
MNPIYEHLVVYPIVEHLLMNSIEEHLVVYYIVEHLWAIPIVEHLVSFAERLYMTSYRLTWITLLFADRSKRVLEGILQDVHVRVGNCLFSSDFVVLAYDKELKDPLILGRAFVATAGAKIDVKNGRISLNICYVEMEFCVDDVLAPHPQSTTASIPSDSVDRHLILHRAHLFTHYFRRRDCNLLSSTSPLSLHPSPELRQVNLLTLKKRVVGGNHPLVGLFFSFSFIFEFLIFFQFFANLNATEESNV